MASSRITVKEARKILGRKAQVLSDEEIVDLVTAFYEIAGMALRIAKASKSDNSVVNLSLQ